MALPEFFGIDFGTGSLKVCSTRYQGPEKARLQNFAQVDMPEGLIQNESEEGESEMAGLINQAREAAGIGTVNCVAAVPEGSVFSRLLTIPQVEPDQIEESVHWELKPMIPVDLSEVDVAFLDIAEKEVGGKQLLDMYVVAAPKALTDRYRKIMRRAKLNLIALETEALATARAVKFAQQQVQGDMVIVDFGGNGTNITLARDGVVVFSQTSSTGSDAFTKAIAADYGIQISEAEKYKQTFGLNFDQGEGKIAKSIEPIIQIVMNDISRTISYFRERVGGQLSKTVFLTGGGAGLPGLPGYIQQKLELEPIVVDLFANIDVNKKLAQQLQSQNPHAMAVALGLALKTPDN